MHNRFRKNHRILSALAAALLLAALLVQTAVAGVSDEFNNASEYELDSNRYAHFYEKVKVESKFTDEGYKLAHENENVAVYLDEKNNRMRILDKKNGYMWGDVPDGKVEGLNKTWTRYATSPIAVEYYDKKFNEKRIGMSESKTKTKYKKTKNGIEISADFRSIDIQIKADLLFTDTGIEFQLKHEDIKEGEKFLLKSVSFLPFFGCSRGAEIDGYFMIPDGQGALMRFEDPVSYTDTYDKKVYGFDYGYDKITQASDLQTTRPNDFSVEEANVYLPVYGIVHGIDQNAVLVSINDGEEYASMTATPAGYVTDFNWATMRFNYRQKYNQPTNKEGGGVLLPNKEINEFDISISYDFLHGEDANYSGMAVFYRNKLKALNALYTGEVSDTEDIPLRIEFLGADVQKKYFFERLKVFTTAAEAEEIIDSIHDMGIQPITAVYKGFFKKGISKSSLSKVKKEWRIGRERQFASLEEKLTSANGKLYYYINPYRGTKKQVRLKNNVGVSISKNYVKTFINNKNLMFQDYYYVKSSLMPEYLKNFISADIYSSPSFAIDYAGTMLFSDYTKNRYTSRSKALELVTPVLEKCSGSAFYNANQYALKYAKDVFDVSTASSQYLYFTDSVPFFSMVLSGSSDTYSQFLNLGCNSKYTLLKLVEYGINPSFLVTKKPSSSLIDTPQEQCFSTCYDDWSSQIKSYYEFVNGALKYTVGQTMQSHTVLAEGVIKVAYENCDLYVNYNIDRFEGDGVTVEPLSYIVKER